MKRRKHCGSLVEILEVWPDGTVRTGEPTVVPNAVRVNGTDLGLVLAESIEVHPGGGGDELATVTVTLIPELIVIGRRASAWTRLTRRARRMFTNKRSPR